jgi:hypothetical protein
MGAASHGAREQGRYFGLPVYLRSHQAGLVLPAGLAGMHVVVM